MPLLLRHVTLGPVPELRMAALAGIIDLRTPFGQAHHVAEFNCL